ncbi:hypothetical protein AYK26_01510 [Euryarchaeota archaeon SM23-78]|nr:MAG: hypothetical protein AYK26_01510 [Euryarchaeota archaeon SM23-78]MBW3000456.1 hypothetical protein [Candidatus Woesearchaeota archaeon]
MNRTKELSDLLEIKSFLDHRYEGYINGYSEITSFIVKKELNYPVRGGYYLSNGLEEMPRDRDKFLDAIRYWNVDNNRNIIELAPQNSGSDENEALIIPSGSEEAKKYLFDFELTRYMRFMHWFNPVYRRVYKEFQDYKNKSKQNNRLSL